MDGNNKVGSGLTESGLTRD